MRYVLYCGPNAQISFWWNCENLPFFMSELIAIKNYRRYQLLYIKSNKNDICVFPFHIFTIDLVRYKLSLFCSMTISMEFLGEWIDQNELISTCLMFKKDCSHFEMENVELWFFESRKDIRKITGFENSKILFGLDLTTMESVVWSYVVCCHYGFIYIFLR